MSLFWATHSQLQISQKVTAKHVWKYSLNGTFGRCKKYSCFIFLNLRVIFVKFVQVRLVIF